MADIVLKNRDGAETTYSGCESVELVDANGNIVLFTEPTDISDFGNASEDGSVIVLPNSRGVDIYCKCEPCNVVDVGYPSWLNLLSITSPDVIAALNSFASALVTDHTEFDSIFSGASTALFMDTDHPCDIPTFSEDTSKSWGGLCTALYSTINKYEALYSYDFISPDDYARDYNGRNISGGNSISVGDVSTFPFVWYPAKQNGIKVAGYLPNTPTGTMPTYETVFKKYEADSNLGAIGFCNAYPAYGISHDVIVIAIGPVMFWYSYGDQTIPADALSQLTGSEWKLGDVTLTEGWNGTGMRNDTTTSSITLEEIQNTLNDQRMYLDIAATTYCDMTDYEKSVLVAHTVPSYIRKGTKSFSITLNVVCEDTTTT